MILIYNKVVGENVSQKEICDTYGYTRGIVNNIINKITWKHITDELDKTIIDRRKQRIRRTCHQANYPRQGKEPAVNLFLYKKRL